MVAVCLAWAVIEFATGTPFWGVIALGCAIYGYWQFFHAYKPLGDDRSPERAEPKE